MTGALGIHRSCPSRQWRTVRAGAERPPTAQWAEGGISERLTTLYECLKPFWRTVAKVEASIADHRTHHAAMNSNMHDAVLSAYGPWRLSAWGNRPSQPTPASRGKCLNRCSASTWPSAMAPGWHDSRLRTSIRPNSATSSAGSHGARRAAELNDGPPRLRAIPKSRRARPGRNTDTGLSGALLGMPWAYPHGNIRTPHSI